jgi:transposase
MGAMRNGMGFNEMDLPLCGLALISHNEVSDTDLHTTARRTSPMKQELNTVAVDLAKKVFHLVGSDTTGKILWRKRLSRHALMPFIAQLPPVLIGIEACGGAHDWARRFREHGHEVRLMAPQFVKPFVKSNKNDMRDAEVASED